MIPIYAAALSSGGFLAPVLAGLLTKLSWGSDSHASWRWALLAVMASALTQEFDQTTQGIGVTFWGGVGLFLILGWMMRSWEREASRVATNKQVGT